MFWSELGNRAKTIKRKLNCDRCNPRIVAFLFSQMSCGFGVSFSLLLIILRFLVPTFLFWCISVSSPWIPDVGVLVLSGVHVFSRQCLIISTVLSFISWESSVSLAKLWWYWFVIPNRKRKTPNGKNQHDSLQAKLATSQVSCCVFWWTTLKNMCNYPNWRSLRTNLKSDFFLCWIENRHTYFVGISWCVAWDLDRRPMNIYSCNTFCVFNTSLQLIWQAGFICYTRTLYIMEAALWISAYLMLYTAHNGAVRVVDQLHNAKLPNIVSKNLKYGEDN